MRLYVDEDAGRGIARALLAVRVRDVDYPGQHRRIKLGDEDARWIEHCGQEHRLVLSRNFRLLDNPAQRQLLVEHAVGIVFFPQHLNPRELLHLVLRRWLWLEQIDKEEMRPFAFRVYTGARTRRIVLP